MASSLGLEDEERSLSRGSASSSAPPDERNGLKRNFIKAALSARSSRFKSIVNRWHPREPSYISIPEVVDHVLLMRGNRKADILYGRMRAKAASDLLVRNVRIQWLRRHGIPPPPPVLSAQQRLEIHECFQLLDEDGSGGLDADELYDAFHELGFKPNRREIYQLLREMDTEGAGVMGLEQFMNIMSHQLNAAKLKIDGEEEALAQDKHADLLSKGDMDFSSAVRAFRRSKLIEKYMEGGSARAEVVDILMEARRQVQAEEEARLNETRTRLDSSTPTARIAFKWMRKAAGHARAMESSRMSPGWSAVSRLRDLSPMRWRKITAKGQGNNEEMKTLLARMEHGCFMNQIVARAVDLVVAKRAAQQGKVSQFLPTSSSLPDDLMGARPAPARASLPVQSLSAVDVPVDAGVLRASETAPAAQGRGAAFPPETASPSSMTGAVAKQSSPGRDALSEAGQGVSGSSGGPQERRGAQAGEPGTGSARRAAGAAEVHEWRSEAGTGTRAGGGDSPVATPRSGTASAGEGSVKRDGGRPAGPPNDSQNSPGAGVRASVWRARSPGTSSAALGDAVLTVEGKECEASSPWGSPARERPVPDAPDTGIPPIPSLICLLPGPEDRSLPVVLSHLPPGAKPFVASSRLKSRGRGRLRIREKRARQRARDLDAAHEHSSSSFFTIQSGADVSGRVTQAGTPTPGAEVSEAFRATRAVGFSSGEADAAGAAFQLPAGGPELRRMHSVAFSSKRLLLEEGIAPDSGEAAALAGAMPRSVASRLSEGMTPSQRGALMGRSSSRLSRGAINLNPSSQSLLSAGGGRLGASRRNAVSNPGGLEDWAEAGEQEEEEEEEEDEMGEEPDFSRKGGADKAGVGPRKTKLETIVSGMPGSVPMVEEVFDPDRNEEHRRQMEDIERAVDDVVECDWSTHNIDTAVWVGKAAFAHAVRTINGNPDPAGPLPPHVASFIQEPSNQDIFGPWASSASLASVSVPQPATRHGHTYGGGRGRGGSAGSEGEGGAGSREGKRRGGSGEGNRTWGPSMGFHSLDRETPGLTEAQQRILNAPKRSTKAPFVTRADLGLEEEAKPAGEEGTSQQPLLAVQEAAARRRRRMATDGIRDKSPDGKMDPDGKKAGDKARKESQAGDLATKDRQGDDAAVELLAMTVLRRNGLFRKHAPPGARASHRHSMRSLRAIDPALLGSSAPSRASGTPVQSGISTPVRVPSRLAMSPKHSASALPRIESRRRLPPPVPEEDEVRMPSREIGAGSPSRRVGMSSDPVKVSLGHFVTPLRHELGRAFSPAKNSKRSLDEREQLFSQLISGMISKASIADDQSPKTQKIRARLAQLEAHRNIGRQASLGGESSHPWPGRRVGGPESRASSTRPKGRVRVESESGSVLEGDMDPAQLALAKRRAARQSVPSFRRTLGRDQVTAMTHARVSKAMGPKSKRTLAGTSLVGMRSLSRLTGVDVTADTLGAVLLNGDESSDGGSGDEGKGRAYLKQGPRVSGTSAAESHVGPLASDSYRNFETMRA